MSIIGGSCEGAGRAAAVVAVEKGAVAKGAAAKMAA
jgi:hypothetical protein